MKFVHFVNNYNLGVKQGFKVKRQPKGKVM